jgi:parallel beta-helix repeat protein
VCGSFQIHELDLDASSNITHLWMTFTQYCECGSVAMTGEIRYQSLLAPPPPPPVTIHVPADYPTIQQALDAASVLTSDTILVSPGVYNESPNFDGRNARLISTGGAGVTFIAPPDQASGIAFANGETSNALVAGFTITNAGTGIYTSAGSPTIVSNLIVDCATGLYCNGPMTVVSNAIVNCGTGFYCSSASVILLSNVVAGGSGSAIYLGGVANALIQGNIIQSNGYGIDMNGAGAPVVLNNAIEGNSGDGIGGVNQCDANIIQNIITSNMGNGITFVVPYGYRGPEVVNNTIVNNGAGGISITAFDATSQIINNVVVGSSALNVQNFQSSDIPVIQNNDFFSLSGDAFSGGANWAGTNGNISTNPFLACLPTGDFLLLAGSPCIDAGTNGAPDLPAEDFEGNPRILAGKTNGPAIVDMGAFEFNRSSPPTPCLYLNPPSSIVALAAVGQNSAVVTYPPPDGTPTATVTCVPASGSVFPACTNVVLCTLVFGTNTLTTSFTVTVEVPPFITNQPSVLSVSAGREAVISVSAIGTGPLSWQWSFDGNAIDDATNSDLTLPDVQSTNEGVYQVTLQNDLGTATSLPILLRVLPSAAKIISGPVSMSVPAGQEAVFSADVAGSAPMSFHWYKNGSPLPGGTPFQLVISNAQATNDGAYQLEVSNYLGRAVSRSALLTVVPAKPSFVLQPVSLTEMAGSQAEFDSLAVGSSNALNPIKYAWYFNRHILSGQTKPDLAFKSVSAANEGSYFVVASNPNGSATSAVVQLTVFLPPSLQAGISNQIVDEGASVVLSARASGTPPLAYSWTFNAFQLSNTTASMTLSNIAPAQSGFYSVTVANLYGSVSSTGRLSVFPPGARVVAWGDDSGGQTNVPRNLTNAVAVAGGDYHSVALRHDGTLVAWGFDDDGQTKVPAGSSLFVAVAAGAAHNLAIKENGTLVAWGANDSGQTDVPSAATSVLSVAAGESHSLALRSDGGVVAWGDNTYGQTSLPDVLTQSNYFYNWSGPGFWFPNPDWIPAQAIAAGRNYSLALLTNGSVVGWGDDSFGQASPPPDLTNAIAISAGDLDGAALCSDGTVVVWGDGTFGETNVPSGLSNVVAIACGDFHTLALLSNGDITGWGNDTYGQLNVPPAAVNAIGIASGYYHGLALVPLAAKLKANLTREGLVIHWNGEGHLQWASKPAGPYADVPGDGNSWTNLDMSGPAKFFRLRQ